MKIANEVMFTQMSAKAGFKKLGELLVTAMIKGIQATRRRCYTRKTSGASNISNISNEQKKEHFQQLT